MTVFSFHSYLRLLNRISIIARLSTSTHAHCLKYSVLGLVCFRNLLSGKPLFKLSCICLPLGKLVNGKHFPVQSTENTFQSTKTLFEFGLVFRKVFSLLAVFVFWKVISGKPLSKLYCVCLPLEKLVNGKHFPVQSTENTFQSTKNTFQSTKTLFEFGLVFRKVFSLLAVFVFRKVISGKPLSKLYCVCLPLEKLVNGKHFPVKGKFGLVFRKVFS